MQKQTKLFPKAETKQNNERLTKSQKWIIGCLQKQTGWQLIRTASEIWLERGYTHHVVALSDITRLSELGLIQEWKGHFSLMKLGEKNAK